jgi:UPF0755 protein
MLIIKIREYKQIIKNYFFPGPVNKKVALTAFFIAFIFSFLLFQLFVVPQKFPIGTVVEIKSGKSLQSITIELHTKNIIRSEFLFRSLVILFGGEKRVIAGDYLLERKQGTFALAKRLVRGQFEINTIKITIPEGWNIFQIADYLNKNLLQFDKRGFIGLAQKKEGYLFPDTYFVSESVNPAELIKMMEDNFVKKIESVQEQINKSNLKIKDIIIMASILEGEALPEDRAVVAGILWKRLEIGMPLQVDSTFKYINGKNTYELTVEDLKIDSLYNTYKYKGLPPGPISNPGLEAIISAVNPTKTKYLYFLTEKDGTIHYAKTFEEHKKNRELYLQ